MKTSTASQQFLAGEILLIGEFRMSIPDVINWRDKKSGVARTANILKTTVETPSRSIILTEFVRDENFKPETYKPPFKKGARVVVKLESIRVDKGVWVGDGEIEALED